MLAHKIEKGIPAPYRVRDRAKYPFAEMEVGDSFLTKEDRTRVSGAASLYGKRHGRRYSVSMTAEGLRVWRLA